jgi:DUF1365 family protein
VQHAFQYPGFFFRLDAGWLDKSLAAETLAVLASASDPCPPNAPDQRAACVSTKPMMESGTTASCNGAAHGAVLLRVAGVPLVSINRRGFFSMHARDHGIAPGVGLGNWLLGIVREAGLRTPRRVTLLGYPRVLGYAFKPVSFWFLAGDDGATYAIVAEVHNTFGERHAYLLHHPLADDARISESAPLGAQPPAGSTLRSVAQPFAGSAGHAAAPPARTPLPIRPGEMLRADKCFTVSPFCTLSGTYRFRFHDTAAHTLARIEYDDEEGALLIASMSGQALPPTPANLIRLAVQIPWQSLGVSLKIHWQALRLYLRRVPFRGARQSAASQPSSTFSA